MQDTPSASPSKAWIITGPTSGFDRRAALELAKHGSVVLVGRDPARLAGVRAEIQGRPGGRAEQVICDLSDIESVRRAAVEIVTLGLPIAGVLNNAGIMPIRPGSSAQGWDLAYATNHLGPFAFTEALIPHLPDGANVVFTCSGVEDPERKPAVTAGFRGGRYISAEASARGEWPPAARPMRASTPTPPPSSASSRRSFIGLGDQGEPMAVAIGEAGYPLHAWARMPHGFPVLPLDACQALLETIGRFTAERLTGVRGEPTSPLSIGRIGWADYEIVTEYGTRVVVDPYLSGSEGMHSGIGPPVGQQRGRKAGVAVMQQVFGTFSYLRGVRP